MWKFNRPYQLILIGVVGMSMVLTSPFAFAAKADIDPCYDRLSFKGPKTVDSTSILGGPYVRGVVRSNDSPTRGFLTSRTLQAYFNELHENFGRNLLALTRDQVWLDVGAGDANAARDYLLTDEVKTWSQETGLITTWTLPPKETRALVVGISMKKTKMLSRQAELIKSGRLRYFESSLHQFAMLNPASVDLISDVRAAVIYSEFDQAIVDIAGLLKPGGKAYFIASLARIQDANGAKISAMDYLRSGTGFTVINSPRPNAEGTIELTRVEGAITLPHLKLKSAVVEDGGALSDYVLRSNAKRLVFGAGR
jgi:SAM-dependent methyltransferase